MTRNNPAIPRRRYRNKVVNDESRPKRALDGKDPPIRPRLKANPTVPKSPIDQDNNQHNPITRTMTDTNDFNDDPSDKERIVCSILHKTGCRVNALRHLRVKDLAEPRFGGHNE